MRSIFVVGLAAFVAAGDPNSQPNPFRTIEGWVQLPAGMQWAEGVTPGGTAGQVVGIDFDRQGNIILIRRADPPLLKFDGSGRKLLKAWGHGMFVQTHGLHVDREGFVWATDSDGQAGKGFQVYKFSADGELLMTLGTKGVSGEAPGRFVAPTDVAVARNGDVFVADGHANNELNHRIVKYSRDGTFIKAWGRKGSGPGEFNGPHDIAIDSRGRLFVADRGNSRVQVFDQEGRLLDQWKQFGRPEVLTIARDDTLVVTDTQSGPSTNPPFRRGIRIGSARDGSVKYFIPDSADPASATSGPVAIAVDKTGSIFAADIVGVSGFPHMLKKYVR